MSKKKILIVEDENDVAEVAREALQADDLEVHVTFDGLSAQGEIAQLQPDLLLLDVMLPTMDGFELCRQLKNDSATRHITIVLFTAAPESFIIERVIGVGADDYIQKPVDSDKLRSKVRAALELPPAA